MKVAAVQLTRAENSAKSNLNQTKQQPTCARARGFWTDPAAHVAALPRPPAAGRRLPGWTAARGRAARAPPPPRQGPPRNRRPARSTTREDPVTAANAPRILHHQAPRILADAMHPPGAMQPARPHPCVERAGGLQHPPLGYTGKSGLAAGEAQKYRCTSYY